MARFKCTKCPKSFPTEQGLNVHNRRIHTSAGKTWGKGATRKTATAKTATAKTTRKSRRQANGGMREKVRRVLAKHPQGLQVKNIITQLKSIGYRPAGDVSGYISQTCSTDPEITRVERGIYRLKTPPTPEPEAPQAESTIEQEVSHSVPALLVRVEQLEKERDALRNAHLMFVREVGA